MEQPLQNLLLHYLRGIHNEEDLHTLLVEYFLSMGVPAANAHSNIEHGMDVVAFVKSDFFGRSYNVIVQAKLGDLGMSEWRKVLYQLLETTYFDLRNSEFNSELPRRIWLVITGAAKQQARDSVAQFNQKHDVTIELLEARTLIQLEGMANFLKARAELATGVGQPQPFQAERPTGPPTVGEPQIGEDTVLPNL